MDVTEPIVAEASSDRTATEAETVRPGLPGRVLGLAWPIISENLLQALLGVVDTLLVAQLGAVAIAGVGTGLQLTFFLISLLSAIVIGISILVAHAAGARDAVGANRLAKQALSWSVIIGIPVSLLSVWLAEPLVAVFGTEPAVAAVSVDFWRIVAGGSLPLILMLTASAILRSVGDSRTPMLVALLANLINAGAAYVLIFGHFGLPALGAAGSAWAANLGRLVGAVILVAVLIKGRSLISLRDLTGWWPEWATARHIFNLGIPAALEQILISLSFVVLMIVIATLGTPALAAQRLALTALSLAFIPGFGFGIAATALVGQSLGARRPAEAAAVTSIATRWAIAWMGGMGLLLLLFGEAIMGLFAEGDTEVIAFGVASFQVIAAVLPFWAIGFVQSGALRGTGNTNYPLRVNAGSMWLSVGLAAVAVGPLQLGVIGGWGAYAVVAPLNAYLLWRCFRRVDWQRVGPPAARPVPVE